MSREFDYRELRRLLGNPIERRPDPDTLVSNLIAAEQYMVNRLSNTGKPWTHHIASVTSVIGTAEYVPVASGFGKALFAYRDLGQGVLLPVPLTDYGTELTDQRYELWVAAVPGSNPVVSGDKIAFFREGTAVKMRVYPVPTEVKTYSIVYGTGALDWASFQWSDEAAIPEFTRLRLVTAALMSIAKCQWEGMSPQDNAEYRRELRIDLQAEAAQHDAEFKVWIRNPEQGPSISEVGYWWE